MAENDIIFTAYCQDRAIDYILYTESPDTFGYEHIKKNRPYIADHIDIVKYGIEHQHIAYDDGKHGDSRERIYCLGADFSKPRMYIAIIVDYVTAKTGKIITTWQTYELKGDDITYAKAKR
jgi:hypothetical protein